jgi:protein disulfide-isomerase
MHRFAKFAAVFAVLALSLSVAFAAKKDAASGEVKWTDNLKEAIAASKKTGKPILADFTGSDWCGWCIKLDKEVFSTPEFAKWANENVVLLVVDFPRSKPQSEEIKKQNQELQKQFGIRGYPTIVFMNAKGEELGRSGYQKGGPEKWTQNVQSIVDKGKK